jgi:hypothetical protein
MCKYVNFLSLAFICIWWAPKPAHSHIADQVAAAPGKHRLEKSVTLQVSHAIAVLEEETNKTEDRREDPASCSTPAQTIFPAFAAQKNAIRSEHFTPPLHARLFILYRAILI